MFFLHFPRNFSAIGKHWHTMQGLRARALSFLKEKIYVEQALVVGYYSTPSVMCICLKCGLQNHMASELFAVARGIITSQKITGLTALLSLGF